MPDVILAALVLSPLVITLLLKSNAAFAFLSLCAGFAVISFASTDLKDLTGQLSFSIDSSILNLVVVGLPLLLTLLFTRRAFTHKGALVINFLIALTAGVLLAVIAVPLLSDSIRTNFADSKFWEQLQNYQAAIIGAGVFLSLCMVWANGIKHHKSVKGKKKHK